MQAQAQTQTKNETETETEIETQVFVQKVTELQKQTKNETETETQVLVQKVPELQKQIVTRILGFKEIAGGKRRTGTIYYEFNRETKTIKYGASIFRTDAKKPEHFVRSDHIQTATNRFNKHPITVTNFPDNTTLQDFNMRIRQLLFSYGCRSK